ncbi:hypothetical protein Q0V21_25220 [Paenibacillus sp. 11B]|uniref:hypothetical protein n=1 Tax=unclassified Paenibacillus TaxID=185978 RepID=UPI00264DB015|nr:hypothetical protein [Paenibacillus sp. 11B]MDN8592052.1 hypothetical protein [Paenibacillus sp. 11B]
MVQDFAKFMATTDKKIVFGDKDVELKLTIPHKVAQQNLQFLTGCLNKEIHVILGDPQAAFDFDDEERDDMYRKWNGHRVTTDQSGVVTRIEKTGDEPEQDENQAQMFGPDGEPTQPQERTGEVQESENENDQPTVPPTGGDDPGSDSDDPYGHNDNDDIPDWMRDGGDDQSGPKEMDFSSEESQDEQQPPADPQHVAQQDPPAGDKDSAPAEIDKEQLEQFILAQRPIFDDIKLADAPADFPALLQMKNDGKTWLEISREMNIPSSQISSKLNVYKKRVTKMMQDGVAV